MEGVEVKERVGTVFVLILILILTVVSDNVQPFPLEQVLFVAGWIIVVGACARRIQIPRLNHATPIS